MPELSYLHKTAMYRTLHRAIHAFGLCLLTGLLSGQPGTLDPTFNPGGAGANSSINSIHVLEDGKLLVAGSLTTYNGTPCDRLARLHSDGTLDGSFQPAPINGSVSSMKVLNDGRIAIHGSFTSVGGVSRPRLAVLLADGSLDPSFNASALISSVESAQSIQVTDMEFDEQCRVLIYLGPVIYGTAPFQNVYRLHPDGTVDNSFQGLTVTDGGFAAFAGITIRSDGRVLLTSGTMDAVNGVGKTKMVLLEPDGTFAQGFTVASGLGAPGPVFALSNGQLILGHGSTYMGPPKLVRLNLDGSIDQTFNLGGTGPDGSVNTIHQQRDGKLWITGSFISYNGLIRYHIAKLHEDGSPDASFSPGYGQGPQTGAQVSGIRTDLDRKPIIFGSFTAYTTAQIPVGRILRLISCPTGNTCVPDTALPCDPLMFCGCAPVLPVDTGPHFLAIKALLQGPRTTSPPGYMLDLMRLQGLVPLVEPFSSIPGFAPPELEGGGSIDPAVLTTVGANAIVDWVLVELRDSISGSAVLAARAALLQRDGDVVDLDGQSSLAFNIATGHYRIAIRHRNHLGVMTANAFSFLPNGTVQIDLRTGSVPLHGTNATYQENGFHFLWAGNAVADGEVKYTGAGNDRDMILLRIGGTVPTASSNGYLSEDLNLDGFVKYTGNGNDRDLILQTIGGTLPTSTRVEQLP